MDCNYYPMMYPSHSRWVSYNAMQMQDVRFGDFPSSVDHVMARQGAMGIEDIIKNKIAFLRRWKQTLLSKRFPKWNFQFSVMTYNILSQVALENHGFLYRNCSSTFIQEDYRVSKILPEILSSRSDIICLQEVEQHVFECRIKDFFHRNGFESLFKKKTSNKSDGCAILWRRNKFDLLEYVEVEFKAQGSKFLNRDNIGLIAVLRPINPNLGDIRLHVATTHLLFNPRRGEVKLCQLRYLLAELERFALKQITSDGLRHYQPIILCGDFNIEPHSPLYEFIESGFVDLNNVLSGDMSGQREGRKKGNPVNGKQLSLNKLGINLSSRYEEVSDSWDESDGPSESEGLQFAHNFNFIPAYNFQNYNPKDIPVTSMTGNDFSTVDHIFYTVSEKQDLNAYIEGNLRLLGLYSLLRKDELIDIGGLPNAHLGSDHTCLIAQFGLCSNR